MAEGENQVPEGAGPARLPAGLSTEWPAPWQPVWGERGGLAASLESHLVRGLLGGASRLPEALLAPSLSGVARLLKALDRRHATAARDFLRTAFGPELEGAELERRVTQAYRHFLRILVDGARFARTVPPEQAIHHFEVDEALHELGRREGGTVLVTGHLGDWEASCAALPWLGYDPVYVIARPPKNRPMSQALQADRERRGVRVLPRNGAMRDARKVVEAGGCVGMLLDQRARKKPIAAPFFGRTAHCDRSAGVLLKRLRVPVLVGACFRTDERHHYRIRTSAVLEPDEVADTTPEELATRINRALEELILQAPDQYFWLHDRYRGVEPAGAP